jgi:hypothetical protein
MRRSPLTDEVRRGLSKLLALARADVECSEASDFTEAERRDMDAALRWAEQALRGNK